MLIRRRLRYIEPGPVVRLFAVAIGLMAMVATVAAACLLMALIDRCLGP